MSTWIWTGVASLLGLAGMYRISLHIRGLQAAERLVRDQCKLATNEDIAALFLLAREERKEQQCQIELAKVQQAYSETGIKVGHMVWISMKLAGEIAADAVAPAFDGPSAT